MDQDMGLLEEWLSTILGQSTRLSYRKGIKYFAEFTGVKCEDLKTLQKPEVKLIQFYSWLQTTKGLSANSARARCVPVQSIYTYMGKTLNIKHKLPEMTPKVENWRPSIEDLQKIYSSNDLLVKCWMSLSRDVPARMSDLLTVTYQQIQSGEEGFDLLSKKEKILGRCYISEQTKELFKQLKASGLKLPTTARGIGIMMLKASKVCGLPVLNQHKWRKIFASKCLDLGISETAWKFMLFKSVSHSDSTYLMNSSNLRTQWQKVIDALPLIPKTNGKASQLDVDVIARALAKMIKRELDIPNVGIGLIVEEEPMETLRKFLES
jgi:hypothetical protein